MSSGWPGTVQLAGELGREELFCPSLPVPCRMRTALVTAPAAFFTGASDRGVVQPQFERGPRPRRSGSRRSRSRLRGSDRSGRPPTGRGSRRRARRPEPRRRRKQSVGNARSLSLQLDVPVEIVQPALVQVVGGKRRPWSWSSYMVGRRGWRRGCMAASRGVRPPLARLQRAQAVTMFSQVVRPPRERGVTWSKVRSSPPPQYWQVKASRRKRLNRVKAGGRSWAT